MKRPIFGIPNPLRLIGYKNGAGPGVERDSFGDGTSPINVMTMINSGSSGGLPWSSSSGNSSI